MLIVFGIVVAFALLLAFARFNEWMKEAQRTRFTFEDRSTYLLLKLDGPLGDGEAAYMSMIALREALLLKVAGMSHGRLLIHAVGLRIANARAFRLLIGALGPVLLNESVNPAVVSGRRSRTARLFKESGILNCVPSVREGERHLQSGQPRPSVRLDAEYVNALLVPGRRKAA
jgi:hypothetical protein